MTLDDEKDRFRTVFLYVGVCLAVLLLGGCSSLQRVFLHDRAAATKRQHASVSERASKSTYASLNLTVDGTGGLLLLTEKADGISYWATGQRQIIVLRHGRLTSTSGLRQDLVMTQYDPPLREFDRPNAPAGDGGHQVVRTWRDESGAPITQHGTAEIACATQAQDVELPLATLSLEKCREVIHWAGGQESTSVYWRDPETHRIWASDTVPWPGGPTVSWEVARPWW